jgi:hypothetical protein
VASALHHVHPPKLDAADVVDYDHETHVVTPRETEPVAAFLDVFGDAS